jgi:hypothetical protein
MLQRDLLRKNVGLLDVMPAGFINNRPVLLRLDPCINGLFLPCFPAYSFYLSIISVFPVLLFRRIKGVICG